MIVQPLQPQAYVYDVASLVGAFQKAVTYHDEQLQREPLGFTREGQPTLHHTHLELARHDLKDAQQFMAAGHRIIITAFPLHNNMPTGSPINSCHLRDLRLEENGIQTVSDLVRNYDLL